jgi:hypothetical protein
MINGRCNLHGGKSLPGIASPRYKHGLYSKYIPQGLAMWLLIRKAELEEQDAQSLERKQSAPNF